VEVEMFQHFLEKTQLSRTILEDLSFHTLSSLSSKDSKIQLLSWRITSGQTTHKHLWKS